MRLQELAGLMEPKALHSWVQARACLQLELRFRALLSDGSPGLLAHTSPRNLTQEPSRSLNILALFHRRRRPANISAQLLESGAREDLGLHNSTG